MRLSEMGDVELLLEFQSETARGVGRGMRRCWNWEEGRLCREAIANEILMRMEGGKEVLMREGRDTMVRY